MPDIETVSHGPWRKKHAMFNEMQCQCVEADEESFSRISLVLEPDIAGTPEESPRPPTFLVPYEEFRELVFGLPEFDELPITLLAWKAAGEPQYFIAKCFSGIERQLGDEVIIDTQGYKYARYKAPVYR
jgi:hypothetical protein